MVTRPQLTIDLRGPGGNVYMIIAKVVLALRGAGLEDKATELRSRVPQQHSYEDVLEVCKEYADIEFVR
jgi:hypothetical protein